MSTAIPVEELREELSILGVRPTYQNLRRLRRGMEIELNLLPTSTYLERTYRAKSQSHASKYYTVTSNGSGVHCHCADSKKSEVCKHALAVMRWEAGFDVINHAIGDMKVKKTYPVMDFIVAIPLTNEWGFQLARVRAESENEAIVIAESDPDTGIIIDSNTDVSESLCPNDQPAVWNAIEFERKYPHYMADDIRGKISCHSTTNPC